MRTFVSVWIVRPPRTAERIKVRGQPRSARSPGNNQLWRATTNPRKRRISWSTMQLRQSLVEQQYNNPCEYTSAAAISSSSFRLCHFKSGFVISARAVPEMGECRVFKRKTMPTLEFYRRTPLRYRGPCCGTRIERSRRNAESHKINLFLSTLAKNAH